MFARKGFEEFVIKEMENKDYMGVLAGKRGISWVPGREVRYEWDIWRPIFKSKDFENIGVFNVGQIYSKNLISHLLDFPLIDRVERNLLITKSWGIDEIVFINLVNLLGFEINSYPRDPFAQETAEKHGDYWYGLSIRYRPHFTKEEL